MSDTQRSVSTSDLETFWMSGAAQEPALELDERGQMKAIRQEPPTPPGQNRSRVNVRLPQLQIPSDRWD
jgi:hypothetical protein